MASLQNSRPPIAARQGRPLCKILSFAIFNNIVLLLLYAVLLYILLRAIFKPFFSPLSGILGPCARPSKRPVARVGPDKVVPKDASSANDVCSVHQFAKTAVYKALQTRVTRILATSDPPLTRTYVFRSNNDNECDAFVHAPRTLRKKVYAPHYASNHFAFFQPEIHDFAQGLSKTLDGISGKTSVDCLLLSCRLSHVIMTADHSHRLGVFKKSVSGAEELPATALGD
ncbi:hypothetical protein FIBSPDRAFT_935015 [Athelia psychrophila]|uniref:Uncharacterized protein n=1 Tax=Athelia psychrophila TaxID=1759441 RepID=A0A166EGD6_9AGAM|nr:hypothetical protein FIBSPDRAFT_935015 [Fibularhizoctonia sp. CBS 109695]